MAADISAAGVFIVFEDSDSSTTTANVQLSAGGTTQSLSGADAFSTFTGDPIFDTPNSTFFIGLVDDTNANSLSTLVLEQSGTSTGYFFDDVTSFEATTVPEPGSLFVLVVAATGVAYRRRRTATASAPSAVVISDNDDASKQDF